MYRIELSPGEETVFRSIEELAVAIKRGVVTPRARIYHNASSKWLPIQFHPHYKTALAMPLSQSALVAGPPVKPLSSLTLAPQAEMPPASPRPASPPPPVASAAEGSEPEPKPKPAKQKSRSTKRPGRKAGKQHRQLRIALVGALLLGGAQWVLSEPLFNRSELSAAFRTHRQFIPAPANTAAMLTVMNPTEKPSAALFGARSAASTDSEPRIEPGPEPAELADPQVPSTDSVARLTDDSVGRKAIKGILRAVGGTSKESAAAKR